jgi:aspartokinase/homoserine dehydrogenase 1
VTIDGSRGFNSATAEPAAAGGVRIFKFGGSSLATPDRIRGVAQVLLDRIDGQPAVVVVSAFQGVTDELLECAQLAARGDPAWEETCGRIAARHRSAVDSLLGGDHARGIRARVDDELRELRDALRDIPVLGQKPPALDLVASFGDGSPRASWPRIFASSSTSNSSTPGTS